MANTVNDKAREAASKGHEAMDKANDAGRAAVDQAKDAGSQVMDKARDLSQQALDKGRDVASRVGDMAGDAAKNAGQRADNLASTVGERAHTAADAVRRHGPQEGMLGSATKAVADSIDNTGRYLQNEGLTGMMGDVGEMIRRNPIPALFVGIGIGYLLSRALDRS